MIKSVLKRFKETVQIIESMYQQALRLVKIIWAWIVQALVETLNQIWTLLGWIAQALVETLNQIWTLLGMFAAWLVLEGSAKTTVGYAIITTLTVWLITIRIRKGE